MSRSLGDFGAKKVGLISEPEVQNLMLTETDKFIIIASDGFRKNVAINCFIIKQE